jgi:predicted transcriptional regulator of viral defense system
MSESERARGYSLASGVALAARLAEEGRYVFTTEDAREAAATLGMPPSGVAMMLSRLARAGWIERLRRGLYAGTGQLPGGVVVHPFAIATALVSPSAISLWSALGHHGLTTQIPRVITVTTTRYVQLGSRTPHGSLEDVTPKRRRMWTAAGTDIELTTIKPDRFFGVEEVWIERRFRVPIMDRERTIIDLVAFPRTFGGLDTALATLDEHLSSLDLQRLVDYGTRYESKAVAARLGWCLEAAGSGSDVTEPLRDHVGPGEQLLDPTRPRRGRRNRRWSIFDNVTAAR